MLSQTGKETFAYGHVYYYKGIYLQPTKLERLNKYLYKFHFDTEIAVVVKLMEIVIYVFRLAIINFYRDDHSRNIPTAM